MKNTAHLVRCGNLMAAAAAPNLDARMSASGASGSGGGSGGGGGGVGGNGGQRRRQLLLRGYINNFTSSTTAHGLNRANAEQSWVRMMWVGIVIAASLGAIFHTTKQVKTYLLYPVSSTNRQEPNSFEFPDLTFCDPLNKRFFQKKSIAYAQQQQRLQEVSIIYKLVYSHFKTQKDWRKERKAIEMIYNAFEHALNITDVNIRPLDMVLYCTFDGEPCNSDHFRVFYHRMYTNCFTFRPNHRHLRSSGMDRGLFLLLYVPSADTNVPLDSLARLASGLENNGVRFQIHEKDTIPHPLEYGIMAPTGTLTAVGLEQVKTSLADTPTHPCVPDTWLTLYDNQFDFMRSYKRQLFDCIKHEYHKEVRRRCGCALESHVIVDPSFDRKSGGIRFCHDLIDIHNSSRVQALLDLFKRVEVKLQNNTSPGLQGHIEHGLLMRKLDPQLNESLQQLVCSDGVSENAVQSNRCYDSCNYNKYEYSLSQCPWPEDSFEVRNAEIQMVKIAQMLDSYMELHEKSDPALSRSMQNRKLDTSSCQTYDTQNMTVPDKGECNQLQLFVRRSIVQLRVYPETLTVRHTIEERSYELVNLCSDLGGVLGLWIGFSIVTLFEFAELFVICASYYWYLCISKLPRPHRNPLRIPKILNSSRRQSDRRDVELIVNCSPRSSPQLQRLGQASRGQSANHRPPDCPEAQPLRLSSAAA